MQFIPERFLKLAAWTPYTVVYSYEVPDRREPAVSEIERLLRTLLPLERRNLRSLVTR